MIRKWLDSTEIPNQGYPLVVAPRAASAVGDGTVRHQEVQTRNRANVGRHRTCELRTGQVKLAQTGHARPFGGDRTGKGVEFNVKVTQTLQRAHGRRQRTRHQILVHFHQFQVHHVGQRTGQRTGNAGVGVGGVGGAVDAKSLEVVQSPNVRRQRSSQWIRLKFQFFEVGKAGDGRRNHRREGVLLKLEDLQAAHAGNRVRNGPSERVAEQK